tara:strand:- start:1255 stop:2304 length:1050 start_codon:yes stop_codon:yes gene_type:complete
MDEISLKTITQEASELTNEEWVDISEFMQRFPSRIKRSSGPDYYKTKLLASPFGISFITRAIDSKKKCVGLTTLTKKMFVFDNKYYPAFELGDSYVSKEFQGRGIYSNILREALSHNKFKEVCKFLYSTPNKNSIRGLLKKGFILSNYKIFTKILPLNFSLLLDSFFIRLISNLYLFFVKLLLSLQSKDKNLKIYELNSLNDLPKFEFKNQQIEQHRSVDYLKWRFINNPDKYLIYAIYVKEKYIGYIIFKEGLHKSNDVLYLADLYLQKESLSYTTKAICRIILFNYRKYAFVSTWISKKSFYWKYLTFCFPVTYKKIPFIIHRDLSNKIFFDEKKPIHFVLSDGDNI